MYRNGAYKMKKYTYNEIYEGANLARKSLGNKRTQTITFNWDGDNIVATWFRGKPVFREDITTNVYVTGDFEDSDCEIFIILDSEEHKDLMDTYNKEFNKIIIDDIGFLYDDEKFVLLDNGKTIKHIATGTIVK